MGKAGSFGGDALEDVIHERIHDAHGFAGDTSVGVNLLQHLVDVDGIAFSSLSSPLLLSFSTGLRLSSSLLAFLSCNFGCHVCRSEWSLMLHRVKCCIYNKIAKRSITIRIEIFELLLVIFARVTQRSIGFPHISS